MVSVSIFAAGASHRPTTSQNIGVSQPKTIISIRRQAKLHAEGASLFACGKHHSPKANITVQPPGRLNPSPPSGMGARSQRVQKQRLALCEVLHRENRREACASRRPWVLCSFLVVLRQCRKTLSPVRKRGLFRVNRHAVVGGTDYGDICAKYREKVTLRLWG